MLKFSGVKDALDYVLNNPDDTATRDWLIANLPNFKEAYNNAVAMQKYEDGQMGANDLLGVVGQNTAGGHLSMTPEQEKWLDNEIARENTQQQQNYELQSRNTSLLSTGEQLEKMGLSASGVLQVGGAAAGVQGSTAATSHQSAASLRQQRKINDYNNKIGLAKSLIGAAGQMASSGIYGAAIGAVKNSAQAVAGAAAHSGLEALKTMRPELRNQLMIDQARRDSRSMPYQMGPEDY